AAEASPVEKQSKTDLTPPRPQRILGSNTACSNPRKSRQLSSIPLLEAATHERHQGDSLGSGSIVQQFASVFVSQLLGV
ncbi:unnamed protein product, partial [Pylaiella littoralis]